MKVTLIHNPSAGEGERSDDDDLLAVLRAAGHQVAYQSSKEESWTAALDAPCDLVAVAGGDGTVGKVARHLLRRDIPIAVLPRGTANNLAHTLELKEIPLPQWVAGWPTARHLAFDIGVASGPWGQGHFLESLGAGFFAWITSRFDGVDQGGGDDKDLEDELRGARRFLRERLPQYSGQPLRVLLDGIELCGKFLLVEAMNIQSIGPNLFFAPGADPSDGLLDVVLVPAENQDQLEEHLRDQREKGLGSPSLTIIKGKHLQVLGEGAEFHLDDRPWPDKGDGHADQPFTVEVGLIPGAVTFLIPAPA